MLPIRLDLTEIVDEFNLTAEQSVSLGGEIINSIVTEYTFKWENIVNRGLNQLRPLYKRAMYVDRISDTEVVFGLQAGEEGLALAIEEGKDPYDQKPYFASSPKRKQTLGGGWYVTVPFRHATPGAVADSMLFQSVLPKEIYDIAKNNGGKPMALSQLSNRYLKLGKRKELEMGGKSIPEYTHKSPKYQGLVRIDISSGRENRGGYFTFRRVSNNSDPLSWIHSGFEAKKFMDKALEQSQISIVADMAIDKFLSQL